MPLIKDQKWRMGVPTNADYWREYFAEKDRKAHLARLRGHAPKPPEDDLSGFENDLRACDRCGSKVLDVEHLEEFRLCLPCHSLFARLDADSLQEMIVDLRSKVEK